MHTPRTRIRHPLAGRATAALMLFSAMFMASAPGASASAARHGRRAHAAQTCVNAGTPAVGASTQAMQVAVVCLVNQQRTARHLPALRETSALDRSAQGWTNQMLRSGNYWHGASFSARITAAGFVWSSAGENIATGFKTPRSVVNAWMGSLGHCQNILDPVYSAVGTGAGSTTHGPYGGTVAWTQDFGLARGESAPSGYWGPSERCPY